jgi:hypothetical protein
MIILDVMGLAEGDEMKAERMMEAADMDIPEMAERIGTTAASGVVTSIVEDTDLIPGVDIGSITVEEDGREVDLIAGMKRIIETIETTMVAIRIISIDVIKIARSNITGRTAGDQKSKGAVVRRIPGRRQTRMTPKVAIPGILTRMR